jgi:CRP-like cAMP-binding protein
MKKKLLILFLITVVANVRPINYFFNSVDHMDYSYSNKTGTFTFWESNFTMRDYQMMQRRFKRFKNESNIDTVLYRITWNNPFKFWRWYDYMTLEKCRLPYRSWSRIENERGRKISPGRFQDSIHPLQPELLKHLADRLVRKEIAKGRYWLKEGQPADKIAFVEKGLMKMFYYHHKKEIITWFSREGDVAIAVNEFFRQQQSAQYIQAMEDTVLWYLENKELQYIYEKYPTFNINARVITENYYCIAEEHRHIMHLQPVRRYPVLKQKFNWLIDRIPDKYLASYLGLTAANLCRYKSQ